MKTGAPRFFRRSILLAVAGILAVVLTACTGVGGGYLPPQSPVFTGPASFGFTFSCEDKGGINPPTGKGSPPDYLITDDDLNLGPLALECQRCYAEGPKLAIQLTYTDHGSNPPSVRRSRSTGSSTRSTRSLNPRSISVRIRLRLPPGS